MEAYKVTATFDLNDLLGPRLAKLWKEMDRLETKTVQVRRRLRDFGEESRGLRQASSAVTAMQRDMLKTEQNMTRMSGAFKAFNGANAAGGIKGIQGEFARAQASAAAFTAELAGVGVQVPELRAAASAVGRMDRNLAAATRNASALTAQLHGVVAAAGRIPNLPRGGGGANGGGGSHARGGWHGGNVHVGSNGVGVGALGFAAGPEVGAAALAAYVGYSAAKSTIDAAAEYQREQAQFALFGMSAAQNAAAKRFTQTAYMPGASMIDKMRYMTEAQGVFRESGMSGDEALAGAKLAAPMLAKLNYASTPSGHAMDETDEKAMLRFVEMRGGLKDPAEFNRIADLGYKVSMTSGGNVDWEQLRQVMRTGNVAAKSLSDEALFAWGEPLIGEMKGGGFGQGLSTAFNRMNGLVRIQNQAYHEMERLRIWDRSKVVENANGGIKSFKGNPLVHSDEYSSNPFKYYVDYIMPMYAKMGLSTADRNRENAMIFGGTGARLFSTLEQQLPTIRNSLPALQQTGGVDAGIAQTDKIYAGQMKQFTSAWTDFKTVFGTEVLPGATKLIEAGTWLFKRISSVDSDDQRGVQDVKNASGFFGKIGAALNWADGGSSRTPNPVAAPASGGTTVHSHTYLDGRQIAEVVSKHQASGMAGNLGVGPFNFGLGVPGVGLK